ncbi:MAG TPA: cysteine desulfurase NifS [Candidatus Glassbacteria bacterium]|nr:cysteine desulfurase NifS [Candidatus Glassbacteria bacterium]
MNKVVYLDNNATTRVAPEVVEAIEPFLKTYYGNPSSIHSFGGRVRKHVEKAREQVAALLNAEPDEIIFTGGGSESDNTAIMGALALAGPKKRHVIITQVEHEAVLQVGHHLRELGYRVTELPVDGQGTLDVDLLESSISDDTAVVSVMWANNETGVVFPVEKIADIVKSRGVYFHTDAVQVGGKIPVDLQKVPVDFLALSGHKFHASKGVGILFIRRGIKMPPYIRGGHQERGYRAGTENVPGIVGIGRAAELAASDMTEVAKREVRLRNKLEKGIFATCKDVRVNGANRLPNTLNVSFEYVEGESILLMLDDLGICASSGSACTSGNLDPSHVLLAMSIPHSAAHGSIRFSLSRYTTEEEIDYTLEYLPNVINRLREISPFVQQV